MTCTFIYVHMAIMSACAASSKHWRLIDYSISTKKLMNLPSVKYFTDRSKAVLLLWIFYVFVLSCVCYVLCASVYMCFVVTCWEGAGHLALVCGV